MVEAFSSLADKAVLVVMRYGSLAGWFAEQAARHENMHYRPVVPPHRLLEYTGAADYGLSVIEVTSLSCRRQAAATNSRMPNPGSARLPAGPPKAGASRSRVISDGAPSRFGGPQ